MLLGAGAQPDPEISQVALRLMLLSLGLVVLLVFGVLLARSLGRLVYWRFLRSRRPETGPPPDPWKESGRRLLERGDEGDTVDWDAPSGDGR